MIRVETSKITYRYFLEYIIYFCARKDHCMFWYTTIHTESLDTTNIIFKNATDSLFCIIVYWAVGYALAYGPIVFDGLAPFIGQGYFFLSSFHNWPQ